MNEEDDLETVDALEDDVMVVRDAAFDDVDIGLEVDIGALVLRLAPRLTQ